MSLSTASIVIVWAEQKIVPDVPMRKLSRTLSGVAAGAAVPKADITVAIAMATLRILTSDHYG